MKFKFNFVCDCGHIFGEEWRVFPTNEARYQIFCPTCTRIYKIETYIEKSDAFLGHDESAKIKLDGPPT